MTKKSINLNRTQKILLVLLELSKGKKKDIRYEDIVVKLFKKYPKEFHLKGYPEYPDSGDGPQRTLYEEKKKGHVTSGNKYFKLTDKGISFAQDLKGKIKGKEISVTKRVSAYTEKEVKRITGLNDVISELRKIQHNSKLQEKIIDFHKFMLKKFDNELKFKLKN